MTLKPLHDQETLEIIQKVSDKIAKKYVFLNHDIEDIKQETKQVVIPASLKHYTSLKN